MPHITTVSKIKKSLLVHTCYYVTHACHVFCTLVGYRCIVNVEMCIFTPLRYNILFLDSSSRANRSDGELDLLRTDKAARAGLVVMGRAKWHGRYATSAADGQFIVTKVAER